MEAVIVWLILVVLCLQWNCQAEMETYQVKVVYCYAII